MKKIYISPATDVYNVNHSNVIMTSPGEVGGQVTNSDIVGNVGESGEWEDIDYSRDNNRGSVWENIW